ncbi:MAG: hypothetical protein PUD25_03485 [Bacilli bacterium]|nr:hypothetical protein [Bacilli bacterium]
MKFDVPKKVIEKLFENGYEDQIVDIVMDFSEDNSREVSDIPISPTMMQDSGKRIIISDKVYQAYQKMINKISNPDTAQEIPYFLLGNIKNIEGEECIFIENIEFCNQESLDDLRVSIDVDRFKNLLSNSPYEVISIGHTHGNVSEDKKNLSLARNLSNDIIQKYNIRDIGLNISISDIWQHEAFKQIASQYGTKEIMQTVTMYNGDIIMISPDKISKSNNIQASYNNHLIPLTTGCPNQINQSPRKR